MPSVGFRSVERKNLESNMANKRRLHLKKGRGSVSNPTGRYESCTKECVDDGWGTINDQLESSPRTTLTPDTARSVITYNQSPDVGFDRSINPYRGCEHGCVYCFARPTHSWLGLSPGLDFETRLFYKPDAVELLQRDLAKKNYRCQPVALGINTDAYQPAERKLGVTRRILDVLRQFNHPVSIVTKSALIERDLDLLSDLAKSNLVSVAFSVTTLDRSLARRMEPRAAAPERRLESMDKLVRAGVPVGVLVAPVIPVLTDGELEEILQRAKDAGACSAGYVLLRLPHELKQMFQEWLDVHEPEKAERIMNRVRDSRGGKEYDAAFHSRMRGTGAYADLINKRFHLAHRRLGFKGCPELDTTQFCPPREQGDQLNLF
jgi:DNA repair photolyase